eukprot:TRINITY_DN5495_c0_g1_i1.p1 TRINITY_DN5495_c0_g1~~TRINITY_DN5495_c0_g1_i1.p1  ORF type:complete len:117 (+),score=21.29 TRINITY_DN5495_c0_g1_i1:40-390(+)
MNEAAIGNDGQQLRNAYVAFGGFEFERGEDYEKLRFEKRSFLDMLRKGNATRKKNDINRLRKEYLSIVQNLKSVREHKDRLIQLGMLETPAPSLPKEERISRILLFRRCYTFRQGT